MTIKLGSNSSLAATTAGAPLTLVPPAGFDSVQAVRITNLSGLTLILNNVHGTDQSQEYLLAGSQMVYKAPNTTTPVTMTDNAGVATPTTIGTGILSEWSTDPDNDFPGTYPVMFVHA